jgi:hypothetical protein
MLQVDGIPVPIQREEAEPKAGTSVRERTATIDLKSDDKDRPCAIQIRGNLNVKGKRSRMCMFATLLLGNFAIYQSIQHT